MQQQVKSSTMRQGETGLLGGGQGEGFTKHCRYLIQTKNSIWVGEHYTLASVFLADTQLATDHPLKNSALILHLLQRLCVSVGSHLFRVSCYWIHVKKLSRLLRLQFRNSFPLTLVFHSFFCSIALHPAPLVRLGDLISG